MSEKPKERHYPCDACSKLGKTYCADVNLCFDSLAYIRADIVAEKDAEKDAEIERLRKALDQAFRFGYARLWHVGDAPDMPTDIPQSSPHAILHGDDVVWAAEAPELAAYLRERDAVSSTDTRPPDSGVQSGVQEPEEGGQNA